MKMKKVLWICIVVSIGLLMAMPALSASTSGGTITLRVAATANYTTGEGPKTQGEWINQVEKATGGKVKFEILAGAVPDPNIYDAIVKGAYDMGMNPIMYNSGRFPTLEAETFPEIGTNCRYPAQAAWDFAKKSKFSKQVEKEFGEGKLVGVWAAAPSPFGISMITANKPVRKIEDMKKLKIGMYGQWGTKVLNALGGVAVAVPPDTIYEDMQRKIVDGSFFDPEMLETLKLKEIAKYLHALNILFTPFWMEMNTKTWDSLPPDVQKIMLDEAVKIPGYADTYHYNIEWSAIDSAKKEDNLELIYYSEEELNKFRAAAAPVKAEYIEMLNKKGLDGQGIMDTWKELFTKYEK